MYLKIMKMGRRYGVNKRIIIVVGKVCSGKDTFAQTLINHTQIDIGFLVKEITKTNQRIHNKDLDKEIIRQLDYRLDGFQNVPINFIITGIRQLSILKYLISQYISEVELIWLDVPDEELKRRFINRQSEKDKGFTFEEVIKRDSELGLGEIEEFIKQNDIFKIIKNY